MASENVLDFETTMSTFKHPRYELIPYGVVHDGREEVAQYYVDSRKSFPDQSNEIISLRHADDAVVVEFWLSGTHKGKLMGVEPTGKTFRCQMTAFFIFDGVDLVNERVYFDSATILRQLQSP